MCDFGIVRVNTKVAVTSTVDFDGYTLLNTLRYARLNTVGYAPLHIVCLYCVYLVKRD